MEKQPKFLDSENATFQPSKNIFSLENLNKFDVIVQTSTNQVQPEILQQRK